MMRLLQGFPALNSPGISAWLPLAVHADKPGVAARQSRGCSLPLPWGSHPCPVTPASSLVRPGESPASSRRLPPPGLLGGERAWSRLRGPAAGLPTSRMEPPAHAPLRASPRRGPPRPARPAPSEAALSHPLRKPPPLGARVVGTLRGGGGGREKRRPRAPPSPRPLPGPECS